MSYLVLARKWRPQTFEDVVGQEHVTRTLQNSLKEDHLAHALLFSGPRGVGKTSIARILAKAMNCEKGPAPIPCNQCGICREITDGFAVDVLEIDGASNRGIDEIRQLRETIRFQPARCRYRIFIIDEVHMLTKEAFNALLKTLEEPPPHVFFIFATTEANRIPATIHSRCQHYEFRRIESIRLADYLDTIVHAENMNLPREVTLLLAREAEGSVRDSLSLLDQVAAYGATSIEDVYEALGVLGTTVLGRLAAAIMTGDVEAVLSVASNVYRLGVDFRKFTGDLVMFFRNLLILKKTSAAAGHLLVEMEQGEAQALLDEFADFSAHSLLNILNALTKAEAGLALSTTPRLTLELLLMRLCSMRELLSVDELLTGIKTVLEKDDTEPNEHIPHASPGRVMDSGTQRPREYGLNRGSEGENCSADENRRIVSSDMVADRPPEPSLPEENIQDAAQAAEPRKLDMNSWKEFVRHVAGRKPSMGPVLEAAHAVIDEDVMSVTLHCRASIHRDMLSDRDSSESIAEMGLHFFGVPVNINVAHGKEARQAGSEPAAGRPGRRERLIQAPLVQEAIDIFDARISNVQIYSNRNRNRIKR